MENQQSTLSISLESLDLDGVNAAVLASLISREAAAVFGARAAAVWRHYDEYGALVLNQAGLDAQVNLSSPEERCLVLANPSIRDAGSEAGLLHALAGQSFGANRPAFLLSLPLISTAKTEGLLLVGFERRPPTDAILREAVPFSARSGGLLRNHEVLLQARERAATLLTLSHATRELFLTLDRVALCQTAVRYACVLAHTPIAYLLMADAAGRFSLPASAGFSSAAFASLAPANLDVLAASQIDKSRVISSAGYSTDERIPHRPEIDDAIDAEGIRSVMATPMYEGRRLVGILYVADREPRTFSVSATDAFARLSQDTAFALGNAGLYEEAAATLRALTLSGEALRAENERLQRIAAQGANEEVSTSKPVLAESPRGVAVEARVNTATDDTTAKQPMVNAPDVERPAAALTPKSLTPTSPAGPARDHFAALLAQCLSDGWASQNGSSLLDRPYRLLVIVMDRQGMTPAEPRESAPAATRARLIASLQEHSWCRSATERDGNVVALVETDVADPSSVIGELLDGHSDISMRAALAPACKAVSQYRSSYVTCRRTLSFLANVGGPRVVETWKTSAYQPPASGRISPGI